MTAFAQSDHSINVSYFWVTVSSLACAAYVLIPALAWSRRFLSISGVAIVFAAGSTVEVLASPDTWEGNIWKFGLAFPVSVILLALTSRLKSLVPTLLALAVIAGIAISAGDRSYFGFVAIVMIVVLMPRARRRRTPGRSILAVAGLLAAGAVVYSAGVALALAGYLGERNRIVTAAQLEASGSVLTSGRSESGAAAALFVHRPLGYGPGVLPSAADVAIGQQGLAGRGLDLTGQYVRDYLFGTGFKLHSITSDLWVNFGIPGILLALTLAVFAARSLTASASGVVSNPLIVFLSVIALWNLAFSPIGSNLYQTIFCVALLSTAALGRSARSISRSDEPDTAFGPSQLVSSAR
ncbi:hypothetical protein [Curtobacterium sp. PhB146]|uniref:hypothetical protein n=1 Tax=Curtobacterium sp. PhB146 TaxID=2485187 RepID=UPI00104C0B58|nr:hypothetical protein [Curtobacterium sp. PhB146]TCU44466.1 hypothetical protein EDF33_10615 [Curtobacterium sp. PhB146]